MTDWTAINASTEMGLLIFAILTFIIMALTFRNTKKIETAKLFFEFSKEERRVFKYVLEAKRNNQLKKAHIEDLLNVYNEFSFLLLNNRSLNKEAYKLFKNNLKPIFNSSVLKDSLYSKDKEGDYNYPYVVLLYNMWFENKKINSLNRKLRDYMLAVITGTISGFFVFVSTNSLYGQPIFSLSTWAKMIAAIFLIIITLPLGFWAFSTWYEPSQ